MGLDMYLYKINKESPETILNGIEVAYWRKANQIRKWFVDHTSYDEDDNCSQAIVFKEDLEQLVEDCRQVLEDHSLADSILPTRSGFFFGSCEYDDWYFSQLEDTIETIENILQTTDWENEQIVYSDWW